VFDQCLDELDLAPTRHNFAPGKAELSVRFATLASIFFEIVNINQRLVTQAVHNRDMRYGRPSASFAQTKTPASLPGFRISWIA
jgi:hypothetical protein